MDPNYNDDQNKLYPLPQHITPSNEGGMMNWFKKHKFATLIGIIILVALIWYFCVKKKGVSEITTNVTVPGTITTSTGTSIPTNVQITKTRLGKTHMI